jgi:hypothetical protein
MINKRGESDEDEKANVLGLILALVVLVLVIFAIYKGILAVTNNPESENAHAALQRVVTKINTLNEKSSINYTLQGYKQKNNDWYLVGWGKTQDGRPDKCFFESCVCICAGSDASSCQSKGECENFASIENVTVKSLTIENREPPTGDAPTQGEEYGPVVVSVGYIKIPQNLIKIELVKTGDSLNITYDASESFK